MGTSADKKHLSISELGFIKKRVPCSDVFGGKPGFAWFKTKLTLPKPADGELCALYFEGVDDNATVFLNGLEVGAH